MGNLGIGLAEQKGVKRLRRSSVSQYDFAKSRARPPIRPVATAPGPRGVHGRPEIKAEMGGGVAMPIPTLRTTRGCAPWGASAWEAPLALDGGGLLDWVASLMSHDFWDQPCPPGGTFQKGPLLAPLCRCPGLSCIQVGPGKGWSAPGWEGGPCWDAGPFILEGDFPRVPWATYQLVSYHLPPFIDLSPAHPVSGEPQKPKPGLSLSFLLGLSSLITKCPHCQVLRSRPKKRVLHVPRKGVGWWGGKRPSFIHPVGRCPKYT